MCAAPPWSGLLIWGAFHLTAGLQPAVLSFELREKMAEPAPKVGFEGLVEATEQETTGYTVNFSSTERESPEAGGHEEITLIDAADSSSRSQLTPDEKVSPPVKRFHFSAVLS